MKLNQYSEFTPGVPDKYAENRTRNLSSLKSNQNCSKLNQKFVIDEQTALNDDVCHNNGKNIQSDSVNDYMLSNYASCDCDIKNVINYFEKLCKLVDKLRKDEKLQMSWLQNDIDTVVTLLYSTKYKLVNLQ